METDGSGIVIGLTAVPVIDSTRCSGCGRCVAACLSRLITLDSVGHRKTAHIRLTERCTRCGSCIESCPISVIT